MLGRRVEGCPHVVWHAQVGKRGRGFHPLVRHVVDGQNGASILQSPPCLESTMMPIDAAVLPARCTNRG